MKSMLIRAPDVSNNYIYCRENEIKNIIQQFQIIFDLLKCKTGFQLRSFCLKHLFRWPNRIFLILSVVYADIIFGAL